MLMFAMIALYLLFSSPLYSSVDPAATADYTTAGYDYFVDDCTPTVELPGKQSHSLPQISPTFSVLSCTRHCYCYYYVIILFNCIACFCRPLLYLPLSYAAYYNYALFSTEPCALLARIRVILVLHSLMTLYSRSRYLST